MTKNNPLITRHHVLSVIQKLTTVYQLKVRKLVQAGLYDEARASVREFKDAIFYAVWLLSLLLISTLAALRGKRCSRGAIRPDAPAFEAPPRAIPYIRFT